MVRGNDQPVDPCPRTRIGLRNLPVRSCLDKIALTQTNRFAAAVSQRSIADWAGFWYSADFTLFNPTWFSGTPWENPKQFTDLSPITYVANVKTPTMLITGEDDHRTPSSEAEQFYQALKLRKVDTALLRIPGASHEINMRPSNMIAQVLNTIGWLDRHRVIQMKVAPAEK